MRHSILKKSSIYDSVAANNNDSSTDITSQSQSKIVRFRDLEKTEKSINTQVQANNNDNNNVEKIQNQINDESEITDKNSIIKTNESESTDLNDLRKYYRKSKSLPFKQINLIGLNGEFIVSSSSSATSNGQQQLQTNSSFQRHQKQFQRTKSMRVISAKNNAQSDFKLMRQNTCPNINLSKTPIATQIKSPTPYNTSISYISKGNSAGSGSNSESNYYYWPSSQQRNSPNYFMSSTLSKSPLNFTSQTNKQQSINKTTNTLSSPGLNTPNPSSPILSYNKSSSNNSTIPLINNNNNNSRVLNSSLLFSTSFPNSNNGSFINDLSATISSPKIETTSSNFSSTNIIDNYSTHLLNTNLLPTSRSNSSHSLTLYTYLVQSSNKNVRKEAKASLLRAQAKKHSESNYPIDLMKQSNLNDNNTATSTNQAPKNQKFSSLANSLLNNTSSLSNIEHNNHHFIRPTRRSIDPIVGANNNNNNNNKTENTIKSRSALDNFFLNNQLSTSYVSPLRLRISSANTISSTIIN